MQSGSAYVEEQWGEHPPGRSPLQRQIRALFSGLNVEPKDVLAGNLVPFRSPDWARLRARKNAPRFGIDLWRELLGQVRPKLVIGMGREVTDALATVLDAHDDKRISVGWGNVTGTRAEFATGTLIRLPHLSRFRIMSRSESAPGIKALFGSDWYA